MKNVYLIDKEWKFIKHEDLQYEVASDYFDMFSSRCKTGVAGGVRGENLYDNHWKTVDIPHDWMVEEKPVATGFRTQGYRVGGRAWYRKHFTLPENINGKRVFLHFEAISIHSEIYVNAVKVAEESCGSTEIFVEITDFVEDGRQVCLAVSTDNYTREGWWYEGGGIFGHTYLIITDESKFLHNSVYAVPEKKNNYWDLKVSAEIESIRKLKVVCEVVELGLKAECEAEACVRFDFTGIIPELWDTDHPKLYSLKLSLLDDNRIIDEEKINIGFRECTFSATDGFILNGKKRKLKGVCLHNDHAGVGVGITDGLMEYRLKKLKDMGCDAIRTSHNPYVPSFYDLCDRMGFLVVDEVRHFSSTEECLIQLEKFVKRDRNHPCVILWSIFNEENLQCTVRGKKIAETMIKLIKSLDTSRFITGGMNGPMEVEGVVKVIDIVGFNYMQYMYDAFHEMHPELPMFASETVSYLTSRGEVTTDMSKDQRCSYKRVMNENLYPWSLTPGETWKSILDREFVMGGFYWNGFDYRGECNNYPSNVSTFGAMDLCGFPKDSFYWNKVLWEDNPQMYLSPYRKDTKEIVCYSNCEEIKIYKDDCLIKEFVNNRFAPEMIAVEYGGIVKAEGYNAGVKVCEKIAYPYEKTKTLNASVFVSGETVIIDFYAHDEGGNFVADADELLEFYVSGGKILGVGNGNTTSLEPDKDSKRRLYNGCCQLIVASEDNQVVVKTTSHGIEDNILEIEINNYVHKKEIMNEKCQIPVSSWRMTDPLLEYPKDNIGDLIFAWIPTTIGYGKNLMFSNKKGFGMIAGTFNAPRDEGTFIIEEIEGNFDLYFNQELMMKAERGVYRNTKIKIPDTLKGKNIVVSIVFKMENDDCGIAGNISVV